MENGKNVLIEVNELLSIFNSYPKCDELNNAVTASIDKIIGKYKQLDKIYDEKTAHGKSQGVSLKSAI